MQPSEYALTRSQTVEHPRSALRLEGFDPTSPLDGPREHPTMSVHDSYLKLARFNTQQRYWKSRRDAEQAAEEDRF